MKTDKAKELAEKALKDLSEALSAAHSERFTEYLTTMSRFHRYSFRNLMLIALQRPDATHVAGFHAWRKLGRFVRKGEKGIAILAPIAYKNDNESDDAEEREVRGFRAVHVFDIGQTDGEPLPEPESVSGGPGLYTDRLHDCIESHGIELQYSDTPPSDGRSSGGKITIRSGLTPAHDFEVMVHELAHELLHHEENERYSKTVSETEAEAVAFVVCQAVGLATGTACSDYIQLYDGNTETLATSLERIQSTSAVMLDALGVV